MLKKYNLTQNFLKKFKKYHHESFSSFQLTNPCVPIDFYLNESFPLP